MSSARCRPLAGQSSLTCHGIKTTKRSRIVAMRLGEQMVKQL
jgi:hypothetical protein